MADLILQDVWIDCGSSRKVRPIWIMLYRVRACYKSLPCDLEQCEGMCLRNRTMGKNMISVLVQLS